MLRSITGLEEVEIIRPGYGIEHDYVDPRQLYPSLETRHVKNLFFAGQINATTGYEEAAAQGLIAGINAALKVKGDQPLILDRSEAYIGVMIDDLTTKGTDEPYRLFSSRCEYRILLREDNADLRLREFGFRVGLISGDEYKLVKEKAKKIEEETNRLQSVRLNPSQQLNDRLIEKGLVPIKKTMTLEELLKRQDINYDTIIDIENKEKELSDDVAYQVEVNIKYSGFVQRQNQDIEKFKNLENIKIPADISYKDVKGLSNEAVERFEKARPLSLGQASRLTGIRPSMIWTLMMYLKKQ